YTTFEGVQSNNLNVHEGGPMQRPRSRLADSAVLSDDSFTLAPPDSFTLAPPLLQTFARGAVADGATDKAGNISRHDLSCFLDMTAAAISGRLAHDAGASGSEGLTNEPKVVETATDASGIAKSSGALDRGGSPAVTSAVQSDQYSVWATDSSGGY